MMKVIFILLTQGLMSVLWAQDSLIVQFAEPYEARERVLLEKMNTGIRKWYDGDTDQYINAFAEELTYFDPLTGDKRILTRADLKQLIDGRDTSGDYSPFIDPRFQHGRDLTVVTYNYKHTFEDGISLVWNATDVVKKIAGDWKIIHTHWSFYSEDIITLPKKFVYIGGIVGAFLFMVIGIVIGRMTNKQ